MPQAASYSFLTAKTKIESYCAYQERAPEEIRIKLNSWGLKPDEIEALISHLITHNFLNEERFASAFVSGKFRIKKWGKIKIRAELKRKKISDYSIQKALKEIDADDYVLTLSELKKSKERLVKAKSQTDKKIKLMRYLASKGYEHDLIQDVLGEE
ncbi:MAG: RecX family transcriptional regulator [Crocinitomicaceae bacterium]|nr:RecX family transcriptional regulator [Crocinitomicaceae bacterium]